MESPWGQWLLGSLLRVLSVFLAYVVASKVTFFAYVASFIGALMSMLVSVIFPSMCYLKIFDGELGWGTRLWNWLVILSGVVAATGGTYAAIVGAAGG